MDRSFPALGLVTTKPALCPRAPGSLRHFRGSPAVGDDGRPRRTVAQLLDAAAEIELEHQRQAEAAGAAEEAHRAGQRSRAREKRLEALTRQALPQSQRGRHTAIPGSGLDRDERRPAEMTSRGVVTAEPYTWQGRYRSCAPIRATGR
jgi:hypothetical protein